MLLGITNVYDFTITPEVVAALQQVWKYKRVSCGPYEIIRMIRV